MKTKTLLIGLSLIFLISIGVQAQTQKPSVKDTLNIGFVLYTKSQTP